MEKKEEKDILKELHKKKHTSKIVLKFDYEENALVPSGLKIETSCNLVDEIIGAIRLWEIANERAKEVTGDTLLPVFIRMINDHLNDCRENIKEALGE